VTRTLSLHFVSSSTGMTVAHPKWRGQARNFPRKAAQFH